MPNATSLGGNDVQSGGGDIGLRAYRRNHDVHDLGLCMDQLSMDTTSATDMNAADLGHINNTSSDSATMTSYNVDNTSYTNMTSFDAVTSHLYGDDVMNGNNMQHQLTEDDLSHCNDNMNEMQTEIAEPLVSQTTTQSDKEVNCSSVTSSNDAIPIAYPEQTVYGGAQRLCYPSCHTYMYHLA